MNDLLQWFDSSSFMPHGHCYLWRPGVLWLNVGSDLLIALSYLAIPSILILFLRKRDDVPFGGIFSLFAAFILLCGTTHAFDVWTVWNPDYQLEGLIKLATGTVSAATAVSLIFVMPRALKLRTPAQLEALVEARTEELAASNARLERAVADAQAAEASRRESELLLRTLLDSIPIMVAFVDTDRRYRLVNDTYLRALDMEEAGLAGRRVDDVLAPEIYRQVAPRMDAALEGEPVSFEIELDLPDGPRNKLVHYTPAFDITGEPQGCFATMTDITATKQVERELEEARQAAESANQAKSDFLANVSHEVRTPLAAILGYTEVLEDQVSAPDARRNLAVIRRNGKHLLDILNDVLDLSKIEAGRMDIQLSSVSPAVLVAEVISLMNVAASEKQLQMKSEFAGPIPRTIRTDPVRVRQVLVNLVSNAIKYTEEGQVTICVDFEDSDEPRLHFHVIDSGIGISPEDQERLFEPFSQVDTTSTRRHTGTGLGLTISRRLTRMLGGDLVVDSTPGKGSRFTASVDTGPLDGVEIAMPESIDRSLPWRQRASEARLQGTVLVVDDQQELCDLVRHFIDQAGAQAECVSDGHAAVTKVQSDAARFDMIIMDMQMPGMDGYEATRRIRAQGYDGPIVALTASAMAGVKERCLEAGCTEYLSKPVSGEQLLSMVGRFLPSNITTEPELQDEPETYRNRVLVVEDNRDAAEALEALLEAEGYEVELAFDGAAAIKCWREFRPDIVLCDLSLPDMDGREVARTIRAEDRTTRVLALTGNPGDPVKLQALGFDEVLTKPVSWAELRSAIVDGRN